MADEVKPNIDAVNETETPATEVNETPATENVDKKLDAGKKPEKSGLEKRIDKLTRRLYEREEAHRREIEALRNERSRPAPKPEGEMSKEELIEAKVNKKLEEKFQQEQSKHAQTEFVKQVEAGLAQVTKSGTERFNDYDSVVMSNEDVTLPMQVIPYFASQEPSLGAALLYEIGKNPEIADTIEHLVKTGNEVDLKLLLNDLKHEVKSKYPAGAKKKREKGNEPLLPVRGNSSGPQQPRPEASAQEHRDFFKRQREEQRKSRMK